MNKLVVRASTQDADGNTKLSWRCIGMNCTHVQSGNPQEDHVLKHASVCNCLPTSLRQEAIEASKDSSLIVQIEAAHQDTNNSSLPQDEHSHTVPQN